MRARAAVLAVLGLLGMSCASADTETGPTSSVDRTADSAPPDPGGGDAGGWTVLVYSMADTDLEPFMLDDVSEMGVVGSGDGLNIVALVDRASGYSDDPVLGLDPWEGAKLLHVGESEAEVLADLGDLNTGDPQVLADFIADGVTPFPGIELRLGDLGPRRRMARRRR